MSHAGRGVGSPTRPLSENPVRLRECAPGRPWAAMDTLKERIRQDTVAAMRARDRARLGALRLVASEIKQREVDGRQPLDDAGVLGVLDRMLKQRRDAAEQFRAAGRDELADAETFEIGVIESYLPAPLAAEAIAALVDEAIAASGASSMRDMGGVMARLRPQVQGRADMAEVSRLVRGRLS